MSLKLATLDEVKSFIGGMETVDKHDALLNNLIGYVSRRFEKECDREFEYSASITETLDGDGWKDTIFVRRPPITSVATIHDDTERSFGSDTLIASTDYIVKTNFIQLDSGQRFGNGVGNIQVVYAGGYTIKTLPDDLKFACVMQTVFLYKRKETMGVLSISGAGGSISQNAPMKLLPEVEEAIQPYRIYRI